MYGDAIDSLNRAIYDFKEQTSMDERAQKIDIAIIEFNDTARVVQNFTPLSQMQPVTLFASGCTAMGAGINLAIDKVKERNRFYNSMRTPCLKAWNFMISNSAPTDDITDSRQKIHDEENKEIHDKFKFFVIGPPDYDKEILTSLTKLSVEQYDYNYKKLFDWIGAFYFPVYQDPYVTTELPKNTKSLMNAEL